MSNVTRHYDNNNDCISVLLLQIIIHVNMAATVAVCMIYMITRCDDLHDHLL